LPSSACQRLALDLAGAKQNKSDAAILVTFARSHAALK